MAAGETSLEVPGVGRVSALHCDDAHAHALLVLAHGAGADMHHRFMADVADRLLARGVATLRYQFGYAEKGRRRIDPRPRLLACVRAAAALGAKLARGRTLLAGGKSMGGRMTSLGASEAALPGVAALVFLGFPLHPAGKPGRERAEHLAAVDLPLLFVQGPRDRLADLALLSPVCASLGPRATLHVVDGADHGFEVLRRSGRTRDEVLDEIARTVSDHARALRCG